MKFGAAKLKAGTNKTIKTSWKNSKAYRRVNTYIEDLEEHNFYN